MANPQPDGLLEVVGAIGIKERQNLSIVSKSYFNQPSSSVDTNLLNNLFAESCGGCNNRDAIIKNWRPKEQ
jgi:hypothetical protein